MLDSWMTGDAALLQYPTCTVLYNGVYAYLTFIRTLGGRPVLAVLKHCP
jgi:hypothetical protein